MIAFLSKTTGFTKMKLDAIDHCSVLSVIKGLVTFGRGPIYECGVQRFRSKSPINH